MSPKYYSLKSGRFVSEYYAKRHPDTTAECQLSEKWITPGDPYPEELEELDPLLHERNRLAGEGMDKALEARRLARLTVEEKLGFGALHDAERDFELLLDEYEKLVSRLGEEK